MEILYISIMYEYNAQITFFNNSKKDNSRKWHMRILDKAEHKNKIKEMMS